MWAEKKCGLRGGAIKSRGNGWWDVWVKMDANKWELSEKIIFKNK